MIIFPAIDIINGQCVRLVRGDYATASKVAEDPLETAKSFEAAGAEWIHMVDLDGAKAGYPVNTEIYKKIAQETGLPFVTAENKFHALTSRDEMVFAHGAMKALAADLMKIANDIRWLASGPRCGLGEITIPENEPGSSIMPGKVNPTQCEAVCMAAVQVMGNDAAVSIAASQGKFELNVYMPVLIYNFLQSARLLSDAMDSFRIHCVRGIEPVREKMDYYLSRSLMTITALSPRIGYENASMIARKALKEDITLKQAALSSGLISEEEYDELTDPANMI